MWHEIKGITFVIFRGRKMKVSASLFISGIISLGIGLFFLFSGWEAYLDYTRTKDYSGRATGHLIKKHFVRASDGNTNYYVDYSFTPSGGSDEINASSVISKQLWDILKDDDKLEIRYDPEEPRRSFAANGGNASLTLAFFIFVLGAVFSVFGASRLAGGFKKRRSVK